MTSSIRNALTITCDSDPALAVPCSFLPANVPLAPEDRETFIEIGAGHLPAMARTWLTSRALALLPDDVRVGIEPVAFEIVSAYRELSGASAGQLVSHTHRTRTAFYLIHADVARAGRTSADVLCECLWASEQWLWAQKFVNHPFNILTDGKNAYVDGTIPAYTPPTQAPHTVAQIMNYLGALVDLSSPYFGDMPATMTPPNNLTFLDTPCSVAIGQVLRPYAWQVRYDLWQRDENPFSIVALGADTVEAATLEAAARYNAHDGVSVYEPQTYPTAWSINNSVPATIYVLFPKWPRPAFGDDPYYRVAVANGSAAITGTSERLFVGDHFDVADKTYSESLETIASERAACWQARARLPRRSYLLNGIIAEIVPAKMVRRVRYSMDLDGAFTHVIVHGLYDETRSGDLLRKSMMRAPAVPEIGCPDDVGVIPRDDGTIDILTARPGGEKGPDVPVGCVVAYMGPREYCFDETGLGVDGSDNGEPDMTGWAIANGNNGTANLEGMFLAGYKDGSAAFGFGPGEQTDADEAPVALRAAQAAAGSGGDYWFLRAPDQPPDPPSTLLPPYRTVVWIQRIA